MACRISSFVQAPEKKSGTPLKRHHADGVGEKSDRHQPAQPAHLADVLFLVAAVNDRAGAEEEERLKKTVREQMHDPGRDPAHA